jgi:hypothetical protein
MYATSNRRLSKYRLVEAHVNAPAHVMTSGNAHQRRRQSIAGGCTSRRGTEPPKVGDARYADGTE